MPDRIERELAKSIKLLPEDAEYALASLAVRGLANKGLIADGKRRRAETWLSATLADLRLRSLPVIRFGIRRADGRLTGLPEAPPTTLQYDLRSGMATAIANPQYVQDIGGVAWGYDYDAAGRQVKATDYPNWP
jgi:YD repeat-containing protein